MSWKDTQEEENTTDILCTGCNVLANASKMEVKEMDYTRKLRRKRGEASKLEGRQNKSVLNMRRMETKVRHSLKWNQSFTTSGASMGSARVQTGRPLRTDNKGLTIGTEAPIFTPGVNVEFAPGYTGRIPG